MKLLDKLRVLATKVGLISSGCAVRGCHESRADLTTLAPLDPIGHEESVYPLCERHQHWADERNKLATEVYEELVEARKEIGQERIAEIQSLAMPQDADLREDILMGDVADGQLIPLEEALDGGEPA